MMPTGSGIGCFQLLIGVSNMFLRGYGGNPRQWGPWCQFNYIGDTFYTQQKTVTVAANSDHISVTAPTLGAFTFLCWLQPASSGNINWAYMASVTNSTTVLYTSTQSTARNFVCTALYRHNN